MQQAEEQKPLKHNEISPQWPLSTRLPPLSSGSHPGRKLRKIRVHAQTRPAPHVACQSKSPEPPLADSYESLQVLPRYRAAKPMPSHRLVKRHKLPGCPTAGCVGNGPDGLRRDPHPLKGAQSGAKGCQGACQASSLLSALAPNPGPSLGPRKAF